MSSRRRSCGHGGSAASTTPVGARPRRRFSPIIADQARQARRRKRPAALLADISARVRSADDAVDVEFALANLPPASDWRSICFYFIGLSVVESGGHALLGGDRQIDLSNARGGSGRSWRCAMPATPEMKTAWRRRAVRMRLLQDAGDRWRIAQPEPMRSVRCCSRPIERRVRAGPGRAWLGVPGGRRVDRRAPPGRRPRRPHGPAQPARRSVAHHSPARRRITSRPGLLTARSTKPHRSFTPPPESGTDWDIKANVAWYGAPELWTLLDRDGRGLDGAAALEAGTRAEDILVAPGRRGRRRAASPRSTSLGRAARWTRQVHLRPRHECFLGLGSAMLVGVDVPEDGCWELTARYYDRAAVVRRLGRGRRLARSRWWLPAASPPARASASSIRRIQKSTIERKPEQLLAAGVAEVAARLGRHDPVHHLRPRSRSSARPRAVRGVPRARDPRLGAATSGRPARQLRDRRAERDATQSPVVFLHGSSSSPARPRRGRPSNRMRSTPSSIFAPVVGSVHQGARQHDRPPQAIDLQQQLVAVARQLDVLARR